MDLSKSKLRLLLLIAVAGSGPFLTMAQSTDAERSSVVVEYSKAVYDFGGEQKKVFLEGPITLTTETMVIQCDHAEVHSSRDAGEGDATPASSLGTIDYILAVGNVDIRQMGTQALAGRAEIFPLERKLVLEDNPRIIDANGVVSGFRIIFLQGDRQIKIESGDSGQRNRIELNDISKIEFLMGEPAPDSSPNER